MKLHRFYVNNIRDKNGKLTLNHELWVNNTKLLNQWLRVLRYKVGDELILFNDSHEKIYQIIKIEPPSSVKLLAVTELEKNIPKKNVILCWSLLKNDKNKLVIQKATEIGIKKFVPILTERCEKTVFDIERARTIAIEASEQCGRFDIPTITEPVFLKRALVDYSDIKVYVCDTKEPGDYKDEKVDKTAVFIGPEGGWSDSERELFNTQQVSFLRLGWFTLRAETACIAAAAKLLQ